MEQLPVAPTPDMKQEMMHMEWTDMPKMYLWLRDKYIKLCIHCIDACWAVNKTEPFILISRIDWAFAGLVFPTVPSAVIRSNKYAYCFINVMHLWIVVGGVMFLLMYADNA